jgi:1-acyl-sn-glycerol-3-phosphate acyltransferase
VIAARKSPLFTRWFAGHAERRIFGAFSEVRACGLDELARCAAERPVLVVSNHTAWWDPLLILYLAVRVLRLDAYAMMDAKNLRSHPFFGKVGAFGVDLDDPADGARAIRYGAKLLDRPGRLVWVFPQGREVPVTARPLGFRRGSAEIARVAKGACVVPAALRYEQGGHPQPGIYVAFGAPIEPDREVARATRTQEDGVAIQLGRIDAALISGDRSVFTLLHERGPSWSMVAMQRILAAFTRSG